MSDNNNKKPERPNPFGSYPYPITNAFVNMAEREITNNNNQPTPAMINGYKEILSAKIGFLFLAEKMKLQRTDGGETAVAKIDEFIEKLRNQYIENWETNVQGKAEFMTNGRLDTKKVEVAMTASAVGLLHPSGGRRTRGKLRAKSRVKSRKKRRKSRRKSKGRKRRRKKRTKRRR